MHKFTREQTQIIWVLSLVNFFNYVDRQVIFPLFHNIQVEFGVSDAQLGMLGSVFMLVHSLASVPLGMLADKYSRRLLITAGVAFWSFASFFSGMATSFKALLGIRSLVGIGEASYAPAATAMISDNFPQEERARAQGYFNAGMFIGGTLGAALGGIIAYHFNWRYAFFFVSAPGFLLAFLSSRLYDKTEKSIHPKIPFRQLLKNPALLWSIVGGTLTAFAGGGYISWGVEFVRRYKGYNIQEASIILGLAMMISGVLGVFLGGYVADRLHKKYAWGRSDTIAWSLLIAAPLMFLGLQADGKYFLLLFFLGSMFLSAYHSPATAVIHDVVPQHMRATAFAFYVLIIHLFGDTTAPAIVGRISDLSQARFGGDGGLRHGLEFVTIFVFLAGICFFFVSRSIRNKTSPEYIEE